MRSRRSLLFLVFLVAGALALLVFLLLSSGQADLAAGPTPTPPLPDVEVLVARRDLSINTLVTSVDDLFRVEPVPPDSLGPADVLASAAGEIQGQKLTRAMVGGQRLQRTILGPPGLAEKVPPGQRAYPIAVEDLAGIADLIGEGDAVDILASFALEVAYVRPGIRADAEAATGVELTLVEDTLTDHSTKALLQNIRVLQIVRPPAQAVAADQAAAAPTADPALTPTPLGPRQSDLSSLPEGAWLVVLAMTPQQVEVLKNTVDRGGIVNLALRSAGNGTQEATTGATLNILVRDFGVPLPAPVRVSQSDLAGTPTLPTPVAPPPSP